MGKWWKPQSEKPAKVCREWKNQMPTASASQQLQAHNILATGKGRTVLLARMYYAHRQKVWSDPKKKKSNSARNSSSNRGLLLWNQLKKQPVGVVIFITEFQSFPLLSLFKLRLTLQQQLKNPGVNNAQQKFCKPWIFSITAIITMGKYFITAIILFKGDYPS